MADSDGILCLPLEQETVYKMILEKEDPLSLSFCKVCSAVLLTKEQRLSHYTGRKHANKVRQYISLQNEKELFIKKQKMSDSDGSNGDLDRTKACQLCNTIFTSKVVAESHYQGKLHAKRLKMEMTEVKLAGKASTADLPPKQKPAPVVANVKAKNDNSERFCSICDASFNNPLMAQQHYQGRKHKKRMTRAKLMETYGFSSAQTPTLLTFKCVVCNIKVNSISQYQSHLSGAKHRNQMKKSGENTTENQQSPVHVEGGGEPTDNKYTPADDEYTPADDEYTPADDEYTPAEEKYTPAEEKYTPANDEYTPADDECAPVDNRYTPADDEYTPADDEYTPADDEYTPAYDEYAPVDNQYTPADDHKTPANNHYTSLDDRYTPADEQYTLADDQYGSDEDQYCLEDEQSGAPYQYTPENGEFSELPQYT